MPKTAEATEALHHREDELFELLRLDPRLGKELGWPKAELRPLGVRDLAAGVDDEGKGIEAGLLAHPLDVGEAISV